MKTFKIDNLEELKKPKFNFLAWLLVAFILLILWLVIIAVPYYFLWKEGIKEVAESEVFGKIEFVEVVEIIEPECPECLACPLTYREDLTECNQDLFHHMVVYNKFEPLAKTMSELSLREYVRGIENYNCVRFSEDFQAMYKELGYASVMINGTAENGELHRFIGILVEPQDGTLVKDGLYGVHSIAFPRVATSTE